MPVLNAIAPDKLARLIGTPGSPVIVDLRSAPTSRTVPGAVPRESIAWRDWSAGIGDRSVVLLDETGREAATSCAALLRSDGTVAEVLEGGVTAWLAAGLPAVTLDHLPPRKDDGRTWWVTRARPKVDRIACPWLIRRFIDPAARFLYVAASDVLTVAAETGAEPFDISAENVFWSHRGERCTFDVMLEAFGLAGFAPLAHLATIVRGADTARPDLVPEAAGLLAVSLGLSRLHADDHAQLEAGMAIYDALYRWCRDARDETHDWTSHNAAGAKVSA